MYGAVTDGAMSTTKLVYIFQIFQAMKVGKHKHTRTHARTDTLVTRQGFKEGQKVKGSPTVLKSVWATFFLCPEYWIIMSNIVRGFIAVYLRIHTRNV